MTNTDQSVPQPFAVIAEFLDGAQVDSEALKHALSSADGREYLVDVLALRHAVARMGPISFPAAANRPRPLSRLATVAAVALLASAAGYLAGGRNGAAPASASPATVEAVVNLPSTAPAPTQVIQLRPGVHWNVNGEN